MLTVFSMLRLNMAGLNN